MDDHETRGDQRQHDVGGNGIRTRKVLLETGERCRYVKTPTSTPALNSTTQVRTVVFER